MSKKKQRPDTRLDRGSGDGAPSYRSCRSRLRPAIFLAMSRVIGKKPAGRQVRQESRGELVGEIVVRGQTKEVMVRSSLNADVSLEVWARLLEGRINLSECEAGDETFVIDMPGLSFHRLSHPPFRRPFRARLGERNCAAVCGTIPPLHAPQPAVQSAPDRA
jgi:hypothetical protein